jgi:hypothetical protein
MPIIYVRLPMRETERVLAALVNCDFEEDFLMFCNCLS